MKLVKKPLWRVYFGRFKHWVATMKYKLSKKDDIGNV